ncbi:MAG: Ultraviolet N-glycosylase/AP lyase [bacterium]|nr:Ultraviolet N-glycosylase/AP lyase [bacterium]
MATRSVPFAGYVPSASQARRALGQLEAALLDRYPVIEFKPKRDPLDELILTILSQATSDRNSLAAFANLCRAFRDFRELLTADVREIEAAIAVGGLGKIKSERIQRVLQQLETQVRAEFRWPDATGHIPPPRAFVTPEFDPTEYTILLPRHTLDLRFLGDYPLDEARRFLTALPGVGEKTAACVLAFAFHREGFPVDTHIHRVLRRVGVLPERISAEKAHHRMYELTQPVERYALHVRIIQFGREVCHAQRPDCHACALTRSCIFYRDQIASGAVPHKASAKATPPREPGRRRTKRQTSSD